jgi:ABC-type lipoprotein export system ATPase subunit
MDLSPTPGNLAADLLRRLSADPSPDPDREMLVLAALEGASALTGYLDGSATPLRPELPAGAASTLAREPLGAYLKSVTVEGFRGVGPKRTLALPPGPGLTLVVGRNGSGKSSFAEALELLLTGDTFRWRKPRSAVWREGWRNLHHKPATIEADFYVEGDKPTRVVSQWKDDGDLENAETFARSHGKKQMPVGDLGWAAAIKTYQPILSYNELGSMLDQGPSKLFDALSAILGLEELVLAQEALAEARKARERAKKEAGEMGDQLLARLRDIDDERARTLVPAMDKKDWGLDAVEAVLAEATAGAGQESDLLVLRQLASLQTPTGDAITGVVRDLREAEARHRATAGTIAAKSRELAAILDLAVRFHQNHGDGDCPICGKKAALDATWHEHRAQEALRLRDAALEATIAHEAIEAARKKALALPVPTAETLGRAEQVGLDASMATAALDAWKAGVLPSADLDALARHIEETAGPLEASTAALREQATVELRRLEDRWKPVAQDLAAWLPTARRAQKGGAAIKSLKAAESWLKEAASEIRNARFTPIRDQAQHVWNQLRLQSNVALDDIRLTGTATKRQVELDVSVDGVEGAALGVMSQGELNALALSLFIPRATLPDSPFRFVVIDDPVQSMDPARVDGLARVLADTAAKRQVVVFTHDDRLPEAVRRLGIPATVIEVTRREASVVELRPGKDPIARYIADAMALAFTENLPAEAARRVVPGLCREALEAACMEAVRRRRLGKGQPHADVEALLLAAHKLTNLAALALFDDQGRGGDVMTRINKDAGPSAGNAFKACNEGAHGDFTGVLVDFVRDAEKLTGWIRKLE